MATPKVVIGSGLILSSLGLYLTPDKWGYGLLGFGTAHLLLGIMEWMNQPERSRT